MRPKIILDLDNTLISTTNYRIPGNRMYFKYGYSFIYPRDHLREFINFVFTYFDVGFWTAAVKDYALFVIYNVVLVGTNYKPSFILTRQDTRTSSSRFGSSKDLKLVFERFGHLGFNSANTIIVDDYDDVYKGNPHNSILIKQFDLKRNVDHDDALLFLMYSFMKQ